MFFLLPLLFCFRLGLKGRGGPGRGLPVPLQERVGSRGIIGPNCNGAAAIRNQVKGRAMRWPPRGPSGVGKDGVGDVGCGRAKAA